jgi:RNA polymerase sigma factor (sigma-70 family)
MAGATLQEMVRRLQRAAARQGGGLTDAELLRRFARGRDEAAFELLLWRHGSMVLATCRRVLGDAHAAEDAFQATFLALARQAGSLGQGEALPGWLHRVACRVALRARQGARLRTFCETRDLPSPSADPTEDAQARELRAVLDEELNRLPEKFRAPVVLCYLEGRSTEEAARRLDCPRGTVLSRLAQARERLRARLTRRGLAVTGALLAATLSREAAAASPAALVSPTLRAALAWAAGEAVPAGLLSARVAALTEGAVPAMFLNRVKLTVAVLLALGLAGVGAALLGREAVAASRAAPHAAGGRPAPAPGPAKKPAGKPRPDRARILGTWEPVAFLKEGEKLSPKDKGFPAAEKFIITKGYIVVRRGGRLTDEVLTYQLDPAQKSATIDLDRADRPGERPMLGVYEFAGDTLRLCLSFKEEERPAAVESKPGSKTALVTLKRSPKPEKIDDKKVQALVELQRARGQSARNLLKIGLALHEYHEAHRRLPAAAIYGKRGKALLSWRVALLPFLGEETLYNQFKLDEPWDSPHNKKLLEQMPEVYAPVGGVKTKHEHATFYRVFTGEGTVFEGKEGVKFEAITDGLPATILAVEAGEAVPWTKPEELPYDGNPLPKLGGLFRDGFFILVGDGSVRFVSRRFHEETFRRAITRADGKAITLDDLEK